MNLPNSTSTTGRKLTSKIEGELFLGRRWQCAKAVPTEDLVHALRSVESAKRHPVDEDPPIETPALDDLLRAMQR